MKHFYNYFVSLTSQKDGVVKIFKIQGKYKAKNMNELTKQQIRKYKIDRTNSKHSMYVHKDIAITIIM